MAIGVFMYPESMDSDQYQAILTRLEAAGAATPKGRQQHFCFGTEAALMVVDVWDTQDDFDAFAVTLGPILQEVGIEAEPGFLQLHNSIQG